MNDIVINPLEVIDLDLPELHFDCDANDPFVNNNISAYFTEQQVISNSSFNVKDELLLMHLNIRSLSKNFDKFSGLVNELKFESAIFGLSETWLNNVPDSMFCIDRFSFITNNRTAKRGGGVGFYVTNNLKYKVLKEIEYMTEDIETIFIEIESAGNKNIIIGEIYRPPHSNINNFFNII